MLTEGQVRTPVESVHFALSHDVPTPTRLDYAIAGPKGEAGDSANA
jgi:hypothetical protein